MNRQSLRASARLTHFFALVALGFAGYLLRRLIRGSLTSRQRAEWSQRMCTRGLKALGVVLEVEGAIPTRGLIVSNHLGYLDILVYGAIAPVTFVSKREVASWPVFGWAARCAGTVFITRERRTETHSVNSELESLLNSGALIVLFPEGTSSDGAKVLPFRSSLLDAAVRSGQPIYAAYVRYTVTDGDPARDVCYWGDMTLVPHLISMARIRRITAHVRFASAGQVYFERKQAAIATYAEVLSLAGLASPSLPVSYPVAD
jgi:1-acyl-sn-glycerol-3-phosphate acyltransferase